MTVQLYYFSGTGNSLFAARELRRRLPDCRLEPVMGALRHGRLASLAQAVGLVFPIHAHTVPLPVRTFLRRVDLGSASYLFALATRNASPQAFADVDRLLGAKGRRLDARFDTQMPQNYIPVFDVEPPEEVAAKDAALDAKLDELCAAILGRKRWRPKITGLMFLLSHSLSPAIRCLYQKTRYFGLERRFLADGRCTGCGTCSRVCLAGKIRLRRGKPVWPEYPRCVFCFACIHYCPAGAIQIRNAKTAARGRYHHPGVSAEDIAAQKL